MWRWLGTGLIFLAGLVLLVLAAGAHLQLLEARKLIASGRQVQGTVTAVGTPRRSTASRYSYSYPVGKAMGYSRVERSIPYAMRDSLGRGSKIAVWFDPANPAAATTTAELAEHESWGNRLFFPLTGIALLGWAIARIVRSRRRPTAPG